MTAFGLHFRCKAGYLNTPSVGVPTAATASALADAVRAWESGLVQPQDYDTPLASARASFARLCGLPEADVASGTSVSSLVAILAASLPKGSRVLAPTGEFTSLTFPFAAQAGRGISITEAPLATLPDRAEGFDLVVVSAVQSADGALVDLEALRCALAGTRTRAVVDVTQAIGWLPMCLDWADAIVGAGYKWLLSPRGAAWLAVRPDYAADIVDVGANWYAGRSRWDSIYGLPLRQAEGARRLDASPAWFSQVGAAVALPQVAALDRTAVHRHCAALADAVRAAMSLPPTGSAIVSVDRPGAAAELAAAGVMASVRAGTARLGFYLYNDANDVDRVIEALRRVP